MANTIRSVLKYWYQKAYQKWNHETAKVLINLGRMQAQADKTREIGHLEEAEFQVFSQRGEDGIIQHILHRIDVPNRIFVEFGVENYTESNTRFLLINNNWSGLVLDGSARNIRFIESDLIYWKYDITAYHSFVTRENINGLIRKYTACTDIGLLSVDIDGNDYWIWEAIDVISPRVVVCEYNSAFGPNEKVSVPYAADFDRNRAHYSNLYFGASLGALCFLADKKGYDFIGTAGAGVNAFFVRRDCAAGFPKRDPVRDFRPSANRDSKSRAGRNSFLPHAERLPLIKELPVTDVTTGRSVLIKDLYRL